MRISLVAAQFERSTNRPNIHAAVSMVPDIDEDHLKWWRWLMEMLIAVSLSGWLLLSGSSESKRMADGHLWTTTNLEVNIADSYCFDDIGSNCRKHGRLYTAESAKRGCLALGTGWRLPTDAEWRALAKHYGGVSEDSSEKGRSAYQALMLGGHSGFKAVLGGGRDEEAKYERLEAHGFYWTATESKPGLGWFYNFGKGGPGLHRQREGEIQRAFSVRCIRD